MVSVNHRHRVQPRVPASGSRSSPRPPLDTRPPIARATHAPVGAHGASPLYVAPGLTEREIAVLKVWLNCDSKVDAGARLHIALGTVNTHLTRIRGKYARVGRSAPTKAALVARALQDGIVTLDDL